MRCHVKCKKSKSKIGMKLEAKNFFVQKEIMAENLAK